MSLLNMPIRANIVDSDATKSLPPKVIVAVQPNVSSPPLSLRGPLHSNTMTKSCIRMGGALDGTHVQESPLQEALSISIATHDPQTPISETSTGRSDQKSSNK
jgi:hypothetical protein